jgi:peroxiredoxin Q/BCP
MKTRIMPPLFRRIATLAVLGLAVTPVLHAPRWVWAAEAVAPKTPTVGDTAPDFTLDDLSGKKDQLSELAKKGPVVLVMLRGYPGYQCPFCTAQVGQLLNKAADFKKAGANVLLVYPGPADGLKDHAREFVRGKDIPSNFFLALDPDYSFTKLYNLRWEAPHETSYPSTFVLNTAQKVLYAKVSKEHGDRAKVEDVLAALPK